MRCLIWKPGSFYRDTIKRVVHENIEIVVAEEKSDLVKAGNIDYIIIGEREHENIQELSEVCEMLNMSVVRVIPSAYVYYLHKKYTKYKYISLFKDRTERLDGITVLNNWTENAGKGWRLIIRVECLWKNVKINYVSFENMAVSICNLADGGIVYSAKGCEGKYVFKCRKSIILEICVHEKEIPYVWIETEQTALSLDYNRIVSKKSVVANQFRDIMEKQTAITAIHEEDYYFLKNFYNLHGTILDIGGNYGQSIYSFMELTKCMKVISIEANPDLWEMLEFYCKFYPGRVQIIKSGVSDKNETITFYRVGNGGGIPSGSFLKEDLEERIGGDAVVSEELLEVGQVDSMVNDNNIWLCKLDIEGLELKALRGMTKILKKAPIFIIEQNWRNWQEILDFMEGYECYYYDWNKNVFTKNNSCNSINYWLIPKKGTNIPYVNNLLRKMRITFN